ncbi:unnamed protein product, partial [Staurois parvus]
PADEITVICSNVCSPGSIWAPGPAPDVSGAAVQTVSVTSMHGYKTAAAPMQETADTAEDMSSSTAASKNAPGSAPSEPGSDVYTYQRMELTQAQIDEVLSIMNTNVDKVLDRNGKISKLEATAEELHAGAKQFQTNTSELRKKPLWKNSKVRDMGGSKVLDMGGSKMLDMGGSKVCDIWGSKVCDIWGSKVCDMGGSKVCDMGGQQGV